MRVLVISSFIGLSACASATADRRCEELETRLSETTARLDETTVRLDEAVRRITELEGHTEALEAREERIRRLEQRLGLSLAVDSTSKVVATGPDLDRLLSCEDGRCTITRAGLDEIFANPARLATQARVVPAMRDGAYEGLKLYGIRPNSLPHRLGFQNGDFVVAVNGHPLGSLDQTMRVYAELSREAVSKIEFDVRRKNESKTLTLQIE
jgi:type II secretory pathway component PulC